MKQLKNLSLAFVAALFVAAQAHAADRIMCEMTAHSSDNLVPPKVLIEFRDNRGSAMAYDGVIHQVYGKPIPAVLEQPRASRYTISWTVKNLPLRGNTTTSAQYIVRLNTKTMKATLTAYLNGYFNESRGSGKCQPVS
ncbi:hypothetical protein N1037_10715 [Phaeobacter sp. G2]|nr:hypothetical protein N1037_10715 [Phaeobacter sp. G2]